MRRAGLIAVVTVALALVVPAIASAATQVLGPDANGNYQVISVENGVSHTAVYDAAGMARLRARARALGISVGSAALDDPGYQAVVGATPNEPAGAVAGDIAAGKSEAAALATRELPHGGTAPVTRAWGKEGLGSVFRGVLAEGADIGVMSKVGAIFRAAGSISLPGLALNFAIGIAGGKLLDFVVNGHGATNDANWCSQGCPQEIRPQDTTQLQSGACFAGTGPPATPGGPAAIGDQDDPCVAKWDWSSVAHSGNGVFTVHDMAEATTDCSNQPSPSTPTIVAYQSPDRSYSSGPCAVYPVRVQGGGYTESQVVPYKLPHDPAPDDPAVRARDTTVYAPSNTTMINNAGTADTDPKTAPLLGYVASQSCDEVPPVSGDCPSDPSRNVIPTPLDHEKYADYEKRLDDAGFHNYVTDFLPLDSADSAHGPDEVVRTNPKAGTEAQSETQVKVVANPDDAPEAGGGSLSEDCGLSAGTVGPDWSPITNATFGDKVPFSLIPWLAGGVSGVATSSERPNATFSVLGDTADLGFLSHFDNLVGVLRTTLAFLMWLGVAWFLWRNTIGKAD